MENVSFTFSDAQRISETVQAVERSKFATKSIDQTNQGDEFVIIYVIGTTKYSDGSQNGNMSFWNDITHLFAQYSPTQTVRVRAANTADTLPVGYVFARYQGVTTRSDSSVGPLYIAVGSSASASGGSATIEVVTDVICTPTGIEVSTVTLSGADYDNAVIRQFLALSDVTPSSYLGNQGRVVKVNDAATGLEFGAIGEGPSYTTFIALSDSPATYGSSSTYYSLTVNSANSAVVFSANNVTTTNSLTGGGNPNSPAWTALKLVNDTATPGNSKYYATHATTGARGWRSLTLQGATDFPANYTGSIGKFLKVNAAGNAVEFTNTFTLKGATDYPADYKGAAGNFVKVNTSETALEFTSVFTLKGATDYPANYTSAGGKFLKVNAGATAVEFVGPLAAVADVTAHTISSVDLATAVSSAQTAIDDLTAQVNLLLARIRSQGLIS